MKLLRGILSLFALLVVGSLCDFASDLANTQLHLANLEKGFIIAQPEERDNVNYATHCPMPHQITNSTSFAPPVRNLSHSQRNNPSPQTRTHSANGSSPKADGRTKSVLSTTSWGKINFPAPYHFSDNALYAIRKLRL